MVYRKAVAYLESFVNYEKFSDYSYKESCQIERVKEFLSVLGNPQDNLKIIHVAGSKGKGSVCAFIAYILRQAGFSVGLYTSPHLWDFRERIRVLRPSPHIKRDIFEGMISKSALTILTQDLIKGIKKYKHSKKYSELTFFEVYTVLAFLYFKERKVDFVVLETGMGGRLDATNAPSSLICAITPISYEHTQKLGNTLAKIAAEKSGIIKDNRQMVFTAAQVAEAKAVIRDKTIRAGAKLFEIGRDIKYSGQNNNFSVCGRLKEYNNLQIKLLGKHQLANACLAIGIVEGLNSFGFSVGIDSMRRGLYNTFWPGRCELISRKPLVVLDGAQNLASAKTLKSAVKENFKYKKLILVLGVSSDKDIAGICSTLKPLAKEIILTCANHPRATSPFELRKHFLDKEIYIAKSVKQAKEMAFKIAGKEDLILVTGSLFLVGEFKNV